MKKTRLLYASSVDITFLNVKFTSMGIMLEEKFDTLMGIKSDSVRLQLSLLKCSYAFIKFI